MPGVRGVFVPMKIEPLSSASAITYIAMLAAALSSLSHVRKVYCGIV
jgi:hypothetical protein